LRTLCAFSILVYFSMIRSCKPGWVPASPAATFCTRLLVFDETLGQPHFAAVNCSDVVMTDECVLLPVSTRSLIFLQLWTACLSVEFIFPDILTWSADSLYSAQWHIKQGSACRRICLLCQQTPPKRWFGNMNMTSNCDVTKSAHQIQMTTICHWMKNPHEIFLRTPLVVVNALSVHTLDSNLWT